MAALLRAVRRRQNTEVVRTIELALETTMRRSELLALTWDDIDLEARIALVRRSKNGESRSVALSPRALELVEACPRRHGKVLLTTKDAVKTAFQRSKAEAGLEDFCFHQLRHEGISRLWEQGLNEVEISSMSGHKNWLMLRRYSHVQATNLAEKLKKNAPG
jgi:integrase